MVTLVVDGDTVEVQGFGRIRLTGIDAPEVGQCGHDEATAKLRKVVDVDDAETGTVRLKKAVDKADEMALDTASTKTTRIQKEG